MTEHLQGRGWRWADAEPLTRGVVAAFSGRVGPNPGELDEAAFVGSLTEAFVHMDSGHIYNNLRNIGLTAIRKAIVTELQKPGAAVAPLIFDMNALARPDRPWSLPEQYAIGNGDPELASGVLEDMSEAAVKRLSEQ